MNLRTRLLDYLLRVLAFGRLPKPGGLYEVNTSTTSSFVLYKTPDFLSLGTKLAELREGASASLLVLEVQEKEPLWGLWISVLLTQEDEIILFGWMPYHVFNRLIIFTWGEGNLK